jgi:Ca-activated chloride channel homolog
VALIQGWLGAVVLGVAVVTGLLAWWLSRPRAARRAVPGSSLDRVRALPGFQVLARGELRRRRLETAFHAVALAGVALMAARLVGVGDDSEEMRTREVVLCLDVSGSMKDLDADVIDAYLGLVDTLKEERIGFVMFDAYAVTAFPLTTEHDYVAEQLRTAQGVIERGQVPGTLAPQVGSSLIGDGLATCVQGFDRLDETRSRTIVLATDNVESGDSIYSVQQAADLARSHGVMVFGIVPAANDPEPTEELRTAVRTTHGDVLPLTPGEPANLARITTAVKAQQKSALLATAQERSYDRVAPGAALLLIGLAGSLVGGWRRP